MKLILNLTALMIGFFLNAQSLRVNYKVKINTNDEILSTSSNYNLIINRYESAYYNTDILNQFKYKDFIDEVKNIGELKLVKLSDEHYVYITQDYVYKNHKQNELIFNEIIFNKKVVVKEKVDLLDWKIISLSDTIILKQRCKKAITKFRGKNYTAYFSNDLINYGGPWKFDGLPGLILSIKSDDNYLIIEPELIEYTKEQENIQNPYESEKNILSWNKFKSLFKEKLIAQIKKLKSMSEDGEGGSIEITDRIEDLGIKKISF